MLLTPTPVSPAALGADAIGRVFRAELSDGSMVYGKIGAFRIEKNYVVVLLDGVGADNDNAIVHFVRGEDVIELFQ